MGNVIRIKRVYDPPSGDDGLRVLVDRLWPRGLSRERARVDVWLKDVAPSDGLRKWFGHDDHKWAEFKKRYFGELDDLKEIPGPLGERSGKRVTLLYGARSEEHNNAAALKEYLALRRRAPGSSKDRGAPEG